MRRVGAESVAQTFRHAYKRKCLERYPRVGSGICDGVASHTPKLGAAPVQRTDPKSIAPRFRPHASRRLIARCHPPPGNRPSGVRAARRRSTSSTFLARGPWVCSPRRCRSLSRNLGVRRESASACVHWRAVSGAHERPEVRSEGGSEVRDGMLGIPQRGCSEVSSEGLDMVRPARDPQTGFSAH